MFILLFFLVWLDLLLFGIIFFVCEVCFFGLGSLFLFNSFGIDLDLFCVEIFLKGLVLVWFDIFFEGVVLVLIRFVDLILGFCLVCMML